MNGMLATSCKNLKIKYLLDDEMYAWHHIELDEWEFLSQLHPSNTIELSDLNILGHCNFGKNLNWSYTFILVHMQGIVV